MLYAAFMPKDIEPELSIFKGMLLQFHILTTLLGYAAWAVTFAASICYLYLEKKEDKNPGLFDQMAYRAAFFAFAFLTLGIITGALWGDRVFGQLWFWDPSTRATRWSGGAGGRRSSRLSDSPPWCLRMSV
jgi:ABC-type transport system involved in cytochrome c biogenesis permease subunit